MLKQALRTQKEKVSDMLDRLKLEKMKRKFRIFSQSMSEARDELIDIIDDICTDQGDMPAKIQPMQEESKVLPTQEPEEKESDSWKKWAKERIEYLSAKIRITELENKLQLYADPV
jgi:hypothetical protein